MFPPVKDKPPFSLDGTVGFNNMAFIFPRRLLERGSQSPFIKEDQMRFRVVLPCGWGLLRR
jgi:hypothetical protein